MATTEIYIADDGGLVIERSTPMEHLRAQADVCKALHNEGLHGDSDLKVLAHVDGILIEAYCNRNGITFAEFMKDPEHARRFLNDPAIDHFRVYKGKV